ncbi:cobalamin-dependent protein [Streptomyces olivaceus]|uniref:cobalamin B12-binding domain-containing protein n=1 Tax=Streptomyces olivaceus TaxID=47716 RepID=UPI001CCDFD30|nr:cobalamin-dependent protein [Streptomyces olivaceus]MBZ6246858.1 cobalamin-dependent protein [Streptomyces olivaceus]
MTSIPASGHHRVGARLAPVPGDERAATWAAGLWTAVRAADEHAALDAVTGALAAGLDAETVLLEVVGAVQHKVGVEWAANRMSVADEHAATAINERVVSSLSPGRPAASLGRVTVACVDREWHALPARLLAETLRLRGWQVGYLGAQVPTAHLVSHLHRTGASAVCLSGSLSTRLPASHAAITAVQATGVPVMVGGLAFGPDGRYARLLGADAWAPDARSAADRLGAGPLPRPRPPHQATDDLPHLADQEFTLVRQSARTLVRETCRRLEARVAALRDYDEAQRERTAEDIAHIVEFLTTALYVDDSELFTGFLTWTGEILAARGVPAGVLLPSLELLDEQLRDFPRARALLHEGRAALASRPRTAGPTP